MWTPDSRATPFYAGKQEQLDSISENYINILTLQLGAHKWI